MSSSTRTEPPARRAACLHAAAALTGGYHLAWVISASIAVVALVIGAVVLQSVSVAEVADAAVEPLGTELLINDDVSYAEAA